MNLLNLIENFEGTLYGVTIVTKEWQCVYASFGFADELEPPKIKCIPEPFKELIYMDNFDIISRQIIKPI